MYDPNNIFARVLRKEIPAQIVFEDEEILAFHDIAPKAPVHILIVPKGEYCSFNDFAQLAKEGAVGRFFQKIQKIAATHNLTTGGYRLMSNYGPHAFQEVPHFHVHLLGGGPLKPMK